VNIGIDGTWHLGGALASLLTMMVGEVEHWRLMFLIGWAGVASLFVMRRDVPESPRWLLLNNRQGEAKEIVLAIEDAVKKGNILIEHIPKVQ
jgi:MFS family permease